MAQLALGPSSKNIWGFDPRTVGGCTLWLDGADSSTLFQDSGGTTPVTATGQSIGQWRDKSGNNNNLTQATSGNRPVYNVSNIITFNGSSQFLTIPNPNTLVANTSFSIFAVERRQRALGNTFFLAGSGTGTNTNLVIGYQSEPRMRFAFYFNDLDYNSVPTYDATNEPTRLWTFNYNSPGRTIHLYGLNVASDTNTSNLTSWNGAELGRFSVGNTYYQGNISEILIYKPALTTAQRQQVEGYLAWKWGLQANLPNTHPYYPYNLQFSPRSISGLSLWLDAADSSTLFQDSAGTTPVTANGQSIGQWRDKSGFGRNATPAATPPQYQQNDQNSLPGIIFSGANTLKSTAFLTDTNFSVFAVARRTNFVNCIIGVWKRQFGSHFIFGDTIRVGVRNQTSYSIDAQVFLPNVANTNLYALTLASSTAPGSGFTFNGSYNGGNTTITGASPVGNTSLCGDEVSIGGLMQSGNPIIQISGSVNEVIIYNTALTTIQRQQIEGYLAWKWGLQANLPSTHPYVGYPGVVNRPFARQFYPVDVTNCQFWFDASDPTTVSTTGTTVNGWLDQSGNQFNLTSGTTKPVYTTAGRNGLNVITFASTTNAMTMASSTSADPGTSDFSLVGVFYLAANATNQFIAQKGATGTFPFTQFRLTNTNAPVVQYGYTTTTFTSSTAPSSLNTTNTTGLVVNQQILFSDIGGSGLTANTQYFIQSITPNTSITLSATSGGAAITTITTSASPLTMVTTFATNGSAVPTGWYVVSFVGNRSLSTAANEYVNNNGTQNGTGTTLQVSNSLTNTAVWNVGGNSFVGAIGEMMFYNTTLSSSQIAQIEGYLAWKWGLQGIMATNLATFSPTSISGCALWLDAADISTLFQNTAGTTPVTASGQSVGQWRDKSSQQIIFTSIATSPSYLNNFNGAYPSINAITGIANVMRSGTVAASVVQGSGGISYALVGRFITNAIGNVFIQFEGSPSPRILNIQNSSGNLRADYGSSVITTSSSTVPFVFFVSYSTANASFSIYYNGTLVSNTILSIQGTSFSSTYGLFGQTYNTSPMQGQISEYVGYSTALTTTQRQQIEGYLAWKWGLQGTLPSSHPYSPLNSSSLLTSTFPFYRTPVNTVTPFNPRNIAGLALWLDAADPTTVTLSGSNVTQWLDKSGNGRNVATTNGTITYTNNRLTFASGSMRVSTNLNMNNIGTLYAVFQPGITSRTRVIVVNDSATTSQFLIDNIVSQARNTNGGFYTQYTSVSNNVPTINGVQMTTNTYTYALNGGTFTPLVSNYTPPVSVQLINVGDGYIGVLYEIILYTNTTLTTSQRQQVEGYLAYKWGIQQRLGVSIASFSPTSISGCALWLDAADSNTVTLISGRPNQWRDKSSNAYTCIEFIGGTRTWPYSTSNLNGLRTMNPAGTALSVSSFIWRTKFTAFIVGFSPTGQFNLTESGVYSNSGYSYSTGNGGGQGALLRTPAGGVNDSILTNTAVVPLGQWFIFSIGYNNGLTATNYAVNGTTRTSTNLATPASDTTKTLTMCFSCEPNLVSVGNVQVAEIIHYNDSITTTQRQQVEGYLAWKWGLQANLPSSHPYSTFQYMPHPYYKIDI
jgi:hypothetical protein